MTSFAQIRAAIDAAIAGVATGSDARVTSASNHTSGALNITRLSYEQIEETTFKGNAVGFTDNMVNADAMVQWLLGDGGSTSYTADLSSAFTHVEHDTTDIPDLAAIDIHPDTELEAVIVKRGSNLWASINAWNVGTAPVAESVTWTDGDTQAEAWAGVTGGNATYGAGVLVAVGDSPQAAWDDGSANQPVIRIKPDNHVDAAAARANNSYIDFPLTGTSIDAATVRFEIAKGGASSPRGYELRSNADSYATSLGTGDASDTSPNYDEITIDVSAVAATTDLSFRLYLYSPSSGSVINVDSFSVEAA